MSVPIDCPECYTQVDETGWGDEEGTYTCSDCDIIFQVVHDEYGGLSKKIMSK